MNVEADYCPAGAGADLRFLSHDGRTFPFCRRFRAVIVVNGREVDEEVRIFSKVEFSGVRGH